MSINYQKILKILSVDTTNFTVDYLSKIGRKQVKRRLNMKPYMDEIISVEKWNHMSNPDIFSDVDTDGTSIMWLQVKALSDEEIKDIPFPILDNYYDLCPDFIEENSENIL